MFKFLLAAFAISIGIQSSAQADEPLSRALNVAPGEYTVNEMVQLLAEEPGIDRKMRAAVIATNREAFADRVRAANGTGQAYPIEVTREN